MGWAVTQGHEHRRPLRAIPDRDDPAKRLLGGRFREKFQRAASPIPVRVYDARHCDIPPVSRGGVNDWALTYGYFRRADPITSTFVHHYFSFSTVPARIMDFVRAAMLRLLFSKVSLALKHGTTYDALRFHNVQGLLGFSQLRNVQLFQLLPEYADIAHGDLQGM